MNAYIFETHAIRHWPFRRIFRRHIIDMLPAAHESSDHPEKWQRKHCKGLQQKIKVGTNFVLFHTNYTAKKALSESIPTYPQMWYTEEEYIASMMGNRPKKVPTTLPTQNWIRDMNWLVPTGMDYTSLLQIYMKFGLQQITPNFAIAMDSSPSYTRHTRAYDAWLKAVTGYEEHVQETAKKVFNAKTAVDPFESTYPANGRDLMKDAMNRPRSEISLADRFDGKYGMITITSGPKHREVNLHTVRHHVEFIPKADVPILAGKVEDDAYGWHYDSDIVAEPADEAEAYDMYSKWKCDLKVPQCSPTPNVYSIFKDGVYKIVIISPLEDFLKWLQRNFPQDRVTKDMISALLNLCGEYRAYHGKDTEPVMVVEITITHLDNDVVDRSLEINRSVYERFPRHVYRQKILGDLHMPKEVRDYMLEDLDFHKATGLNPLHPNDIATAEKTLSAYELKVLNSINEYIKEYKAFNEEMFYRRYKSDYPYQSYPDEGTPEVWETLKRYKTNRNWTEVSEELRKKAAERAEGRTFPAIRRKEVAELLKTLEKEYKDAIEELARADEAKRREREGEEEPSKPKEKDKDQEKKFLVDIEGAGERIIVLTKADVTFILGVLTLFITYRYGMAQKGLLKRSYVIILVRIFNIMRALLIEQTGKKSERFYPLFLIMFYILLIVNIIGLLPGSFCLTSQLFITLTLSLSVFVGLTIYGFKEQGYGFLRLFVPKNVPTILLPFLVLIEVISYLSRVLSLAIRLFANMVAGHALLHILIGAGLGGMRAAPSIPVASLLLIPVVLLILAIMGLESGIAFLQAYVFVTLSIIYLNDSINGVKH